MTLQERIETLEEVLRLMDECAQKLGSLGDDAFRSAMAEFEGRAGGWVGLFTRDNLEAALREAREELTQRGAS